MKTHFVCWTHAEDIDQAQVIKRGTYPECIAFLRSQWDALMRSVTAEDGYEVDVRYADGRRCRWAVPGVSGVGAGQGSGWKRQLLEQGCQSEEMDSGLQTRKVPAVKSKNRAYPNQFRFAEPSLPVAKAVDWRTCSEPELVILNFPARPSADDLIDLNTLVTERRSNLLARFLQEQTKRMIK